MNPFSFLKRSPAPKAKPNSQPRPSQAKSQPSLNDVFQQFEKEWHLKVTRDFRFENKSAYDDMAIVEQALRSLQEDFSYREDVQEAMGAFDRVQKSVFVHATISDGAVDTAIENLLTTSERASQSLAILREYLHPSQREILDRPEFQGVLTARLKEAAERNEVAEKSIRVLRGLLTTKRETGVERFEEEQQPATSPAALEEAMRIYEATVRLQNILWGFTKRSDVPEAEEALKLAEFLLMKMGDNRTTLQRGYIEAATNLVDAAIFGEITLRSLTRYLEPTDSDISNHRIYAGMLANAKQEAGEKAATLNQAVDQFEKLRDIMKVAT